MVQNILYYLDTLQRESAWKFGILILLLFVKIQIWFYSRPDICTLVYSHEIISSFST